MAQFIANIHGSRGPTSRLGDKRSGIITSTKSWEGQVNVNMWHDAGAGRDMVRVVLERHGGGDALTLYAGPCAGWEAHHAIPGSLGRAAWRVTHGIKETVDAS
jgi:hypothetical protein